MVGVATSDKITSRLILDLDFDSDEDMGSDSADNNWETDSDDSEIGDDEDAAGLLAEAVRRELETLGDD